MLDVLVAASGTGQEPPRAGVAEPGSGPGTASWLLRAVSEKLDLVQNTAAFM
eukprot:COSAG06_NODE_31056_length_527_cov_1.735981_1_plen_52_part_10